MNSLEMMYALHWLLDEAECYIGSVPTQDPHEAARKIVTYLSELDEVGEAEYHDILNRARDYAKRMAARHVEVHNGP